MKKIIVAILVSCFFALGFAANVQAATPIPCTRPVGAMCYNGCREIDQCGPNNQYCVEIAPGQIFPNGGDCGSAVIGGISAPQGVGSYNCSTGYCTNIGIFAFISVALRLFTIICGLFILFNFLIAGYTLIASAGNTQKYTDIRERLTFALIGLVIIVAAYMLAAMIGLIFFGSATFILNPDISQYSALSP